VLTPRGWGREKIIMIKKIKMNNKIKDVSKQSLLYVLKQLISTPGVGDPRGRIKYYLGIFVVGILIVGGAIYILRAPQSAEATWWNITWSYRQSISISNSSGSELTDFQIQILDDEDLSSLVSAGKLESDLSDLRFTDINHRVLDYWIEDTTNSEVDVWIKVPSIPTTGTIVYMYYGNSSAVDESDATKIIGNSGNPGTSCTDIKNNRDASTGIYYIRPGASSEFQAYCDMDTENGGWTQIINLDTNDGIDHWWGDTDYWQGTGTEGSAANSLTAGYKSQAFTDMSSFAEMMFFMHTEGVEVAYGVYDVLEAYQSSSFYDLLNIANSDAGTTITGTQQHQSGASNVPLNTARSQTRYGDEFVDSFNTEAVVVNRIKRFNTDGINYMRLATTFDNTSYVHTFSGLGVHHERPVGSYISKMEVAPVTAYCGNVPYYGTDATATGYRCGSNTSYDRDMAIFVRDSTPIAVTLSIGTPASEENAPGPIGYWNFDEGYGDTAYDSTGYGNDGTITGATWVQNGRKGGALSFDGVDDYVQSTDVNVPTSAQGSVSFWLKLPENGTTNGLFHLYEPSGPATDYIRSYISAANVLDFVIEDDDNILIYVTYNLDNLPSYIDEWLHIVWVQDGVSMKLYINGENKNVSGINSGSYWTSHLNGPFRIRFGNCWAPLKGLMDEIRLYDRALSTNEIKQLYNQGAGSFNVGQSRIPRSCADQLAMNPSSKDGTYTIDPGYGIDPLEVYCDMTTEGGGWTRVMWNNATGSAVAPDDIMINSYDESDHWSINPEEMSRILNSQDAMLKQITQVSVWPSSWTYLVAEDIGNWDYDQPLCTGSLLGHTGRSVGCPDHGANDNYNSYDGFNIAIYTDTSGGNDDDAFVPKYTYDYYKPSSNTGHIEFYIRENVTTTTHGLVLDLPFESQSGSTTYDVSGYENNGTITGATWKTSAHCKEGRCFEFDGTSDYINISSPTPTDVFTDDYTVSFWVYPEDLSKENHFFSTSYSSSPSILLYYIGEIRFIENDSGNTEFFNSDNLSLNENEWYYLTLKRLGTDLYLYVNGVQRATATSTGVDVSSRDYQIGWAVPRNKSTAYFNGLIDQVKIYNVALTQREIMEEMHNGKPGPILDLDFNESSGSIAYDKSGQGNDGTILSNTSWALGQNCVSGNCVYIDGTNSALNSIQVSEDDSLDAVSGLSVSLWFKIDSLKNHQIIYKRQDSGIPQDFSYMLYVSSNNVLDFRVSNESGTVGYAYYSEPLIISTWYHVVGIYNGSEVKIYVDGSARNNTSEALTGNVLDSNGYLQIGGLDGSAMMDGSIDELRIYPYALTSWEIKQEYVHSKGQFGQTSVMNNNTMVLSLDYDTLGDQMTNPGLSCLDILNRRTETPEDGIYWVDPNGGILDGFQVYCDMTNDGGGWALVLHAVGGSSLSGYATVSSYNLDQSTDPDGTTFKFSDVAINSLASGSDPVYRVNTFGTYENTRFWDASAVYGHITECAGTNKYSYSDVDLTTDQHGGVSGGDMGICDYNGSGLYFQAKSDPESSTNWYTGPGTSYTAVTTGSSPNENALMWIRSDIDVDSVPVPELPVISSVATSSPLLDMDFDQYSGGVYLDKSGNGYNGTPSGDPTWKTAVNCKEGRCLDYDGTDDKITLSSLDAIGTDDYTFVTSFKYTETGSDKGLFGGVNNAFNMYIKSDSRIIIGKVGVNDTTVLSAGNITEGNWYTLALVRDGTAFSTYLNGAFIQSGTDSNDYSVAVSTIGTRGAGSFFKGYLDEVKIYNRALIQTEISELYNGGAPIGWWRFDEGADDLCSDGADVCDNSGRGNNGIINGAPTWITDTSTCKQGGCMDFNGVDDYIQFSSGLYSNMLDEGTITAWAKTDTHDVRMEVINLGGYVILNLMSGKWQAIAYDAVSVDFLEGSDVVDGEWTNLILTWTGSESKFYIDGKEIANDVTSGPPLDTGSIAIGAQPSNHGNKFDGKIDDTRIYNYALTEEQIKEVYNGGLIRFTP
jgi:hypothetical protein